MDIFNLSTTKGALAKGIGAKHFIANVDDILTFPDRVASPTTPADRVLISADIVFKSLKGFYSFPCEPEMGQVTVSYEGSNGRLSPVTKVSVYIAGNTNELHAWRESIVNGKFVLLISDASCKDGQYKVVGCTCDPAQPKPSWDSGKARGDEQGLTVEFEAVNCEFSIYTGAVDIIFV